MDSNFNLFNLADGQNGNNELTFTVTESLRERISIQKESNKLDLSLCYMRHVPLETIGVEIGEPPAEVDLSYNSFFFISEKFAEYFGNIRHLDLSKNFLQMLPCNFGDINELIYLDLHNNQLRELPLSMCKMTKLQYLNISNNRLRAPFGDLMNDVNMAKQGISVATLVTSFLGELNKQVKSREGRTITRVKSKKSVSFQTESGGGSGDVIEDICVKKERNMKGLSTTVRVSGTLAFFLFMVPMLSAFWADEFYYDNVVKQLETVSIVGKGFAWWWSSHRYIYQYCVSFVNFLQAGTIFRGPTPPDPDDTLLTTFVNYLRIMFNYVKDSACLLW